MIEPAILASIHARLDRALTLPASRYRPFIVDGARVGYVDDVRAARLAEFGPDLFRVDDDGVMLAKRSGGEPSRSAAIATVARALRAEGALPGWRNELFAVVASFGDPAALLIERGAARYFGVRTFSAHVNGLVGNGNSTAMWLARRSPSKAVDPGMLDNLVGGGISAGLSIEEAMVKEAREEAGLDAALARTARSVGVVYVARARSDGLQRETIFVHDLWLPTTFVPANQDGEAVEHRLVPVDDAARAIAVEAGADEVTVDASTVVLDFLIRNGSVDRDSAWGARLHALCHRDGDALL